METREDLECVDSKEIELDPGELRELENEILKQGLAEQGCSDFGVALDKECLIIKCKENLIIEPTDRQSITIRKDKLKS